ncbi:MFS transporter, YNFM family, putative membrane transport protein [Streptomyces zhaozhouensis]|uniref:MFS transporter, YNFM family, putative membrane transport protein n=1 Tax=Streptomyces zhaozhouensis TaxID=1300267 RepID=A0A286DTK9_9ACTN|nr:MFS transporter, YNFM family, putative membrane transport protein [Streptomyces zhaozhouensis]
MGASAPPFVHPQRSRINLALFAIGMATFAMLFSTQALLPDIAAAYAVSPDQASWTVSAATIGLALAVLPLSTLSERFGRVRLMTLSVATAVALALLLPLAPDLGTLVVLRALQGAAIAGIPASAVAYLSEELDPKATVGAIGLFIAGNSVGGMSGRVLTGWVAEGAGWRAALAAVAALAVVAALVYRLLLPKARFFTPSSLRPRLVLDSLAGHLRRPLLLRLYAIGLLLMAAFSAVYTVIGFRLVEEPFGLSAGLAGSIFVIYLVGTASSAVSGPLLGRLGRRGALYAAIGTTVVGLLLTASTSLAAVLTGLVLITGGFFFGHAIASGSVSRVATHGKAHASALYQVAYYLGASLGGTLGAAVYHRADWSGLVAFALLALVATAVITLYATARARTRARLEAGLAA